MKQRRQPVQRGTLFTAVFAGLFVLGCDNCQKLEEKICADLGEGCEVWKTDMNKAGMPTGRKPNKVCKTQMGDAVYPALIKGLREGVESTQAAKAKAAK